MPALTARNAFRFVLTFGMVNFFADMTYESARGINGPFLGSLGASAVVVGFVAGFGELIGYGLCWLTGYLGDRTGRYWAVALTGYIINLLAVPALALASNWSLAAGLIVAERTGRGIRKSPTNAMLSFAGKHLGQGWVFGLNEALDQAGATLGPLVVALVFYLHGGYRGAYAMLLAPAVLAITVVLIARYFFPNPRQLEPSSPATSGREFTLSYWVYVAAAGFLALGFADFALIGFHLQRTHLVPEAMIPVFYAVSMVIGALGSLIFGRLFDRFGIGAALVAFALGAFFAPLVFMGHGAILWAGIILWGIGMGAQGALFRPMITGLIHVSRRGTAYGVFDASFGLAWFAGSVLIGFLYSRSLTALVIFSVATQLIALPLFVWARRLER